MCYYAIKGKPGAFVRRINQQMSSRVKTDPAFEQTRKYASEFGYAGALAAKSFYKVPGVTAEVAKKSAQGDLTKFILSDLGAHGHGEFGHRYYRGLAWQQPLIDKINQMSKNKMDECYPMKIETVFTQNDDLISYTAEFHLNFTDRMRNFMETNGINKVRITMSVVGCTAGFWADGEGAYKGMESGVNPTSSSEMIYRALIKDGSDEYLEDLKFDSLHGKDFTSDVFLLSSGYVRPIVIVQAYKTISGQDVELQRFSAFKILDEAVVAGGEIPA